MATEMLGLVTWTGFATDPAAKFQTVALPVIVRLPLKFVVMLSGVGLASLASTPEPPVIVTGPSRDADTRFTEPVPALMVLPPAALNGPSWVMAPPLLF